jgi:hypothetical protein
LVGLEFNPNIEQSETYQIVANTTDSITVDIVGKPELTDIAQVGDTYAAVYHFDNVYLRGGGKLILGDQMVVNEWLEIQAYGTLSHYAATLNSESRLDLTVGTLDVVSSGTIDADGLGYLGGNRLGNDCSGQTLGNANGASIHSAGSYGGSGGALDGLTNSTYGDPVNPIHFGSGGSCGDYGYQGGNGGGLVLIRADDIVLDGSITANGSTGSGYQAGSGSGGTVNIATSTLTGNGSIRATGGAYQVGGGGGRISIQCSDSMQLPVDHISVSGGQGSNRSGTDGTKHIE